MNVLIVAKTRMNPGYCVGGLVLESNRHVRLLPQNGHNQPNDTPFSVGQVWDLHLENVADVESPHTEDVRIIKSTFLKSQSKLASFLSNRVQIFPANPQYLFDGLLRFTGKDRAYICQRIGVPSYSTCFWLPDRPLVKTETRYQFQHPSRNFEIAYVGAETAVDIIPPNTLVRLSLARWWSPEDSDMEERCYLQLSGWYID
jgi:hypothetical protein